MGKYSARAYQRNRDALKRQVARHGLPCAICEQPIDLARVHPDPLSFSADHVTELGAGGNMAGPLAPTHLGCNSSRGGRFSATRRRERLRRNSFHEDPPGLIPEKN